MRRRTYVLKKEPEVPVEPTKPDNPNDANDNVNRNQPMVGFGFMLTNGIEGLTEIFLSFDAQKNTSNTETYKWEANLPYDGVTYNDIFSWFANEDNEPFSMMTQNINECYCVINNETYYGSIMMMPETVVYSTPFTWVDIYDALTNINVFHLTINETMLD